MEQAPTGAPAGVSCYRATFSKAFAKGKIVEFDVVATITGVFKPNPSEIKQGEKQYVEYYDNLYLLSPYVVEAQTTNVSTPASSQYFALVCCTCSSGRIPKDCQQQSSNGIPHHTAAAVLTWAVSMHAAVD